MTARVVNGQAEAVRPTKRSIRLTVNGEPVVADVEPRLQLAELLREHLMLTGTHLGCEHGVCGACTVYLEGAPARSCITYAITCDGADVRTIEGFDEDAVMAELRDAFSAEHALQCGYCTPGMLVTARDIVLRLPNADEARVRKELAGNLCRCTGYVGIVRAIQRVLAKRGGAETSARTERSSFDLTAPRAGRAEIPAPAPPAGLRRQPAGGHGESVCPEGVESAASAYAQHRLPATESTRERPAAAAPRTTLRQSFTVGHPREKVWTFFGRLDEVTGCLPGAAVTGMPSADRVDTLLRVKLGPIVAEFTGTAEMTRDPATCSGVIRGSARDARSSSTTRGEIRYVLTDERGGAATRVDVDVDYTLSGTLAQFGRSGLVQDIARRMTAAFAGNLEARLAASAGAVDDAGRQPEPTTELDAGSLLLGALWARLKAAWRSLRGR